MKDVLKLTSALLKHLSEGTTCDHKLLDIVTEIFRNENKNNAPGSPHAATNVRKAQHDQLEEVISK